MNSRFVGDEGLAQVSLKWIRRMAKKMTNPFFSTALWPSHFAPPSCQEGKSFFSLGHAVLLGENEGVFVFRKQIRRARTGGPEL